MRYYIAMESLLLPEDMKANLKADLTDHLVGLYKLIIDFQVQRAFYSSIAVEPRTSSEGPSTTIAGTRSCRIS
jgi:hypothetical protein